MIGRVSFTAVLAASLCACAGAQRPRVSPAVAGPYEFSGVVAGVGPVTGRMDVAPSGAVSPASVAEACPSLPVNPNSSIGCDVRSVRVVANESGSARRAIVVIAVNDLSRASEGCDLVEPTRCSSNGRTILRQKLHRGVVEIRRSE